MTEMLRQSLSAVIDDEADAFELRRVLDELDRNPDLRALWDRYHLIGGVLRGEYRAPAAALRERVWQALARDSGDDEEAQPPRVPALQPEPAAAPAAAVAAALSGERSRVGRVPGLAVAASVAFAVVIGFNGLSGWSGGNGGAPQVATALTSQPAVSVPLPVTPRPGLQPELQPRPTLAAEASPSDVQRAQAYMLHHTQHQALNQPGVMSFVKMATYEAP